MIKKMTDEILENPKERDNKQKTQDDAVSTREFSTNFAEKSKIILNFQNI